MRQTTFCLLCLLFCVTPGAAAEPLLDHARWFLRMRELQLQRLRGYRLAGRFPRNEHFPGRYVPYFRDRHGTLCAVGYLVQQDGGRDIVEGIVRADNHVRLRDVRSGPLIDWIARSGLTREECALIQPTYWQEPPGLSKDIQQSKRRLIELIRATIAPDHWEWREFNIGTFGNRLVLTHTPQAQRELQQLLARLRGAPEQRRIRRHLARVDWIIRKQTKQSLVAELRRKLRGTRLSVAMREVRIQDVVRRVRKEAGVNIILNSVRIQQCNPRVTLQLTNVSAYSLLSLAVEMCRLAIVAHESGVLIVTDRVNRLAVQGRAVRRTYDVGDLLHNITRDQLAPSIRLHPRKKRRIPAWQRAGW